MGNSTQREPSLLAVGRGTAHRRAQGKGNKSSGLRNRVQRSSKGETKDLQVAPRSTLYRRGMAVPETYSKAEQ